MVERKGIEFFKRFEKQGNKSIKKYILVFLMMCICVFSMALFSSSSYMLLSFLVMAIAVIPFFLQFEKRKPKAREVVLIVAMSGICVAIHLGFSVTFPIQAGSALIFLTGCCLGTEAGFIVGAMSRLVCNFYMGHGPWSPWQMMAWGVLGLLGGLIFADTSQVDIKSVVKSKTLYSYGENKSLSSNDESFLREKRDASNFILSIIGFVFLFNLLGYILFVTGVLDKNLFTGVGIYIMSFLGLISALILNVKKVDKTPLAMAIACGIIIFVIYGGLMNMSVIATSGIYSQENTFSLDALKTIYISGVPYDLFHGTSAAIVVYFVGDKMVKKIERIRIKYGIYC